MDYEGDEAYLSFFELEDLCKWISLLYPASTFFYTISVRSELYDIEKIQNVYENKFLENLMHLYKKYNCLQLIFVAGNKKYLSQNIAKQKISSRLERFVIFAIKQHKFKSVHIGVDKIFSIAKRIMLQYTSTKAIFLLNPVIKEQLLEFLIFEKDRLLIYALKNKNIVDALNNQNLLAYLHRRGELESNYKKVIKMYSILDDLPMNEQYIDISNYFVLLFEF